jgi:hypothetical protein
MSDAEPPKKIPKLLRDPWSEPYYFALWICAVCCAVRGAFDFVRDVIVMVSR